MKATKDLYLSRLKSGAVSKYVSLNPINRDMLLGIIGTMHNTASQKSKIIATTMSESKIVKEINAELGFDAIATRGEELYFSDIFFEKLAGDENKDRDIEGYAKSIIISLDLCKKSIERQLAVLENEQFKVSTNTINGDVFDCIDRLKKTQAIHDVSITKTTLSIDGMDSDIYLNDKDAIEAIGCAIRHDAKEINIKRTKT